MSSIQFRKVQSVAKDIRVQGERLDAIVLQTLQICSDVVGATLGPGGLPVLIERQETGMPNMVTKDGVTAFRGIGLNDPTMNAIMESARDASVRTASEAGDGTTTATVLSEALLRYTQEFRKKYPKVSPQRVLTVINKLFEQVIEPRLKQASQDFAVTDAVQRAVLLCSTNGDAELADAVQECFRITGDAGNVTLLESGGPRAYRVEPLKGYVVGVGFEESCRAWFGAYLNDRENNGVRLERPGVILHFGAVNSIEKLVPLMERAQESYNQGDRGVPRAYVLCATGFSDTLLAQLAGNFSSPETIKVYPLLVPKSPFHNSEKALLEDLQALTGGVIFNDIESPLELATPASIGASLDFFEAGRYRSNFVGMADESLALDRVSQLEAQLRVAESEYERGVLRERVAKLTGGIAKLTVVGASTAEIRERKDRAEDAVCALRGALKHGALPGATAGLRFACQALQALDRCVDTWVPRGTQDAIINEIVIPAFRTPFIRLATNAGYNGDEVSAISSEYDNRLKSSTTTVWDGRSGDFVDATTSGIVDSLPAVLEAIRNSISAATLLGTLGATIVFQRDAAVERQESADAYHFLRNSTGS